MCLMVWGLFLEARPKVVEELTIEAGGDLPELSEFMLRELLKEAISRRLVADVPIGFYISGGLDSSVVAAILESTY